eukprot:5170633-Pyramimonas_sp.AAC.1
MEILPRPWTSNASEFAPDSLLQEGVQRDHERRLAESTPSFVGERVSVDSIRSFLRSKRTSPQAKYW